MDNLIFWDHRRICKSCWNCWPWKLMQNCNCWMNYCLDHSVTYGAWPPLSPDLTSLGFYLWGTVRGIQHCGHLRTPVNVQQCIINECAALTSQVTEQSNQWFIRQLQLCINCNVQHFEHPIVHPFFFCKNAKLSVQTDILLHSEWYFVIICQIC
jgi:hypothetical protein